MLLGVPGRVLAVRDGRAVVDFWGVSVTVRLDTLPELVVPGDHVSCHAGFALQRIPAADVATTLARYEMFLRRVADEDWLSTDVQVALAEVGAPRGHA